MGFASWQHYCTAFQYWASATPCGIEQRALPIFGRAAIMLGIGPHSNCRHILTLSIRFNYMFCYSAAGIGTEREIYS